MSTHVPWVVAARFAAVYQADIAAAVLEAAGIEARVSGGDFVGIFGPGWSGPSTRGVDVLVPADRLDEARDVLTTDESDDA